MRILVTGATGFVGSHLCEYLENRIDTEVYGLYLDNNVNYVSSSVNLIQCDLTDKQAVVECLVDIKPDYIFHLAGIASVPEAWKGPEKVIMNNVIGQLNVLEALARNNLSPRVLIVSTGEVYGAVDASDLPLNEKTRLKPNNPYAVSKVTQELLGVQYFENSKIPVIISRSFNHVGPRQKGDFVVPSFVRQIVDIEQGKRDPVMYVGNLESERDFLDVRDVVTAYWELATKGSPGEAYNVCSGKKLKIKRVLEILLKHSTADIEAMSDSKRMRPSDTPVVVGDNSKLKQVWSWQPKIAIEKSLKDALEHSRSEKKKKAVVR